MTATSILKYSYYSYFASPTEDRFLYREILNNPPEVFMQIGLGDAGRAGRLIRLIRSLEGGRPTQFIGIDLFESASTEPRLSYKEAYKKFQAMGVPFRLLPGSMEQALATYANVLLGKVDFLLIGHGQPSDGAWKYVPRMLAPQARIFQEQFGPEGGKTTFQTLSLPEIEQIGRTVERRQRRAA